MALEFLSFEDDEAFTLTLSGLTATGDVTLGTGVATGTILDDDATPTLSISSPSQPEGNAGTSTMNFVVSLSAVSGRDVSFTRATADGSATVADNDYVAIAPGSLSIPAGSTSLTIPVTINGDTTFEGNESFNVNLTGITNATPGTLSGTGTLEEDDQQPTTTTITAHTPSTTVVGQPYTVSVNVAAQTLSPTGTVTLTSGASSCSAMLPATSCNLSFATLGSRTVSASYAGDANFNGSISSGAGNTQTLVYAPSDLAVTKSNGVTTYSPDELLVYTVTVRNLGADAAANIRVTDIIPAGLIDVVWSCDASGGVACPQAGGSGNLDVLVTSFPVGGLLNFTFYGNVDGSPPQIANTATITLPADTTIEDPVLGNNSATDSDLLEFMFRDGFEDPQVNAPVGSQRLPTLALRNSLDGVARVVYVLDDAGGEALRVYARVLDDEVQYALAGRGSNGALRLAQWQGYAGETTLSWTARAVARGWMLEGVELR